MENQILSTNLVNLRKLYFFSLKHSLNCQIKILQENEQNLRKLKEKESDDFKFLFEEAVTKRSNDGRTLRSEVFKFKFFFQIMFVMKLKKIPSTIS